MFNLENYGIDLKVEANKTTLPFYFDRKNECVKCGAINSLVFIDNSAQFRLYRYVHFLRLTTVLFHWKNRLLKKIGSSTIVGLPVSSSIRYLPFPR